MNIVATLPGANGRRFVLEALERMAATEGYEAFASGLALDEPLRSTALRKIGGAWVIHDPYGALAAANRVPHALKSAYTLDVFLAWARVDSKSVAQYFETAELDSATLGVMIRLRHAILAHPESGRVIASRLPESYREIVEPN